MMQSGFLIYQDVEKYYCFNVAVKGGHSDSKYQIEWVDNTDPIRKLYLKKGSDEAQVFTSYKEVIKELEHKFGPQLTCQRG